ncbi:hypothetical protein Ahy_A05g022019 isoform F [Arachis hypogaea]|nr:hypothetical protein Ahy_A05g022019 isoform F [Arachis hypogaea]
MAIIKKAREMVVYPLKKPQEHSLFVGVKGPLLPPLLSLDEAENACGLFSAVLEAITTSFPLWNLGEPKGNTSLDEKLVFSAFEERFDGDSYAMRKLSL